MRPTSALLAAAPLAFALAACQQASSDENIAIDETNGAAYGDVESLPPSDEGGEPRDVDSNASEGDPDRAEPAPPPAALIPAQYRGRWGMVAADCQPGRSDAKGLITIGDQSIRFYESTATLKEQRPAIATSFSGLFSFTGEGQSWEKVMTFTRAGDTLKRAEPEGNFTYKRCD